MGKRSEEESGQKGVSYLAVSKKHPRKSNSLDVDNITALAQATHKKVILNLIWATGYKVFAIPIAAGVLYKFGIVLSPAVAAIFMSLSTVICAVNAQMLRISK